MKNRIFITDPIPAQVIESFKDPSFELIPAQSPIPPNELVETLKDFDAVLIRTATRLTASVIKNSHLKAIARAGVGLDNVDLKTASELKIPVFHAPNGNTISTAEYTVALILSTARFVPQAYADLSIHQHWNRKQWQGTEVFGKTLGIIGFGKIGRAVAKRCAAFGMKIIAYDPYFTADPELDVSPCSFEECLKESDFITLHLPLNEQTRHLIGQKELKQTKKGVRIINASRGEILDEQALLQALKERQVSCAALDVFSQEPPLSPSSPLLSLPNCICLPHLGAATKEARERVAQESLERMLHYLKTGDFSLAANASKLKQELL